MTLSRTPNPSGAADKSGTMQERRYEKVRKLGEGGMGSAYLVFDKKLGKYWAMKVWREETCRKADFRKECMALRDIDSTFFPRIVDAFWENGKRYLIMDWVNGITLEEQILDRGRLSAAETCSYGLQICDALEVLHKRIPPMLHLDLKPSNIILTQEGIRLIDFGSALSGWTGIRPSSATPDYASSELIRAVRGERNLSGRTGIQEVDLCSDIYSLGAVMLTMLTGKRPKAAGKELEKRTDVPEKLKRLIRRAMDPDPARRFQSVEEMKRELLRTDRKDWSVTAMHLLMRASSLGFIGWAVLRGAGLLQTCYGLIMNGENLRELSAQTLLTGMMPVLICCLWERLINWIQERLSMPGRTGLWYCQEKNCMRTDKKSQIWLGILLGLCVGMLAAFPTKALLAQEASGEGERLPIAVRDSYMRKILIRTGYICETEGPLYLEISEEMLESGETMHIRVTGNEEGKQPRTYTFSCRKRDG